MSDNEITTTLADRADDVAKEIVSIATSDHFGRLREDMIERVAMQAMLGETGMPAPLRAALGMAVIHRLGIALVAVIDEAKAVSR